MRIRQLTKAPCYTFSAVLDYWTLFSFNRLPMSFIKTAKIGSMSLLFGFMTGFIQPIGGNTLNFRLAQENTNKITLGLISIVSLPYALSFILTIYAERLKIPYISKLLGNKTSTLLLLHIIIGFALYKLGHFNLSDSLGLVLLTSIIISAAGAIQDNFFGAIRINMSKLISQRFSSGMHVTGCRIGMICTGPLAILMSIHYAWSEIYTVCALMVFCFPIITILYLFRHKNFIDTWANDESVVQQFIPKKSILLSLLFVVLYNMPDNMLIPMLNPFLLERNFTAAEIALSGRFVGYCGSVVGAILGSWLMQRSSIQLGLLRYGFLHGIAHSGYALLAFTHEKSVALLLSITAFESITGGIKMAAGVMLVTSLCATGKNNAGNYAFFTSILGISKAIFPCLTGVLASLIPWPAFFVCMSLFAIPSLLLLRKLPTELNDVSK